MDFIHATAETESRRDFNHINYLHFETTHVFETMKGML